MEDYYSDEEIEEKISEGDWEFDETGDIFFERKLFGIQQ
jgi:hypothetical protein